MSSGNKPRSGITDRRILRLSSAVASTMTHQTSSVRRFYRSHSPPPSATGRIWSASHSDRRAVTLRIPHIFQRLRPSRPRLRFSCTYAFTVSSSHSAHTPASRRNTWLRRYSQSDSQPPLVHAIIRSRTSGPPLRQEIDWHHLGTAAFRSGPAEAPCVPSCPRRTVCVPVSLLSSCLFTSTA